MNPILAKIYRAFTFICIGIITGLVAAIKIIPQGDEIKIGKIKVKGKGNRAETSITLEDTPKTRKDKRKDKRKDRREIRNKPV